LLTEDGANRRRSGENLFCHLALQELSGYNYQSAFYILRPNGGDFMNTISVTVDTVTRLLRQLPPRERLRVIVHILPDLERDLPDSPSALDFWEDIDVLALAERQDVRPVDDFDALLGGWPEDEPIDDFIATVRQWRRQSPAEVNA
jgi:hypothetical protein